MSSQRLRRFGRPAFSAMLFPILSLVLIGVWPTPAWSKDYVVRFIEETFKSAPAAEGTAAKIYHTWAVETDFGKKLLVLTGQDSVRRDWLREFTKDHEQFLAKVPEAQTGAFELNTVVEIDVADLHPISAAFLETPGKKKK